MRAEEKHATNLKTARYRRRGRATAAPALLGALVCGVYHPLATRVRAHANLPSRFSIPIMEVPLAVPTMVTQPAAM